MAEVEKSQVARELDLLCSETSNVTRSFEDMSLIADDRVLTNMLKMEEEFLPSGGYFSFQPEIKPYMRSQIADWMLEVCKEERCEREVFVLAINYMDRFLSQVPVKKTQFQLLGTVSMFVASKLKNTRAFCASHLAQYTDFSVTVEEILELENILLQTLNWNISVVTPYDFIDHLLIRLSIVSEQRKQICDSIGEFVNVSMTELKFAVLPPSLLASVSIQMAILWLGLQREHEAVLMKLHQITNSDLELLKSCQEQLWQFLLKSGFSVPKNLNISIPKDADVGGTESSCAEWEPTCASNRAGQTMTPTDLMDIVLIQ